MPFHRRLTGQWPGPCAVWVARQSLLPPDMPRGIDDYLALHAAADEQLVQARFFRTRLSAALTRPFFSETPPSLAVLQAYRTSLLAQELTAATPAEIPTAAVGEGGEAMEPEEQEQARAAAAAEEVENHRHHHQQQQDEEEQNTVEEAEQQPQQDDVAAAARIQSLQRGKQTRRELAEQVRHCLHPVYTAVGSRALPLRH